MTITREAMEIPVITTAGPNQRFYFYLTYLAGSTILFGVFFDRYDSEYWLSLFLLYVLSILVPSIICFKRILDLFEPIYLFSLYYYLFCLSGIYLIYTDLTTGFTLYLASPDIIGLFNQTLVLLIIGYLMLLLGYYAVITKTETLVISFADGDYLTKWLFFLFIIPYICIGLLNFCYVSIATSGNPIAYILSVGSRKYQEEEVYITTLGYHFYYAALYLWFYLILNNNFVKTVIHKLLFSLFLVLSFIVAYSTGRITLTLTYIMSFIVLYYYSKQNKAGLNPKIMLALGITVMLGIILYFGRVLSSLQSTGVSFGLADLQLVSFSNLTNYLIGRGNIPNIPVVMKIIESWQEDVGLLYGRSLFYWVLGLVGQREAVEDLGISCILTNLYYYDSITGHPPASIIGELYANFGYVGIPLGMFLFGAIMAFSYNFVVRQRSYLLALVYVGLLTRFYFVIPKGEFLNLEGAVFLFLPTVITFGIIKLFRRKSVKLG